MKLNAKPSKAFLMSCIFMVLTLAWLTVSLPFVYAAQQKTGSGATAGTGLPWGSDEDDADNPDNPDNPFANTTEEKTPTSLTISEEYLHDTHSADYYSAGPATEYKVEHVALYISFHGELISPPPDAC